MRTVMTSTLFCKELLALMSMFMAGYIWLIVA